MAVLGNTIRGQILAPFLIGQQCGRHTPNIVRPFSLLDSVVSKRLRSCSSASRDPMNGLSDSKLGIAKNFLGVCGSLMPSASFGEELFNGPPLKDALEEKASDKCVDHFSR